MRPAPTSDTTGNSGPLRYLNRFGRRRSRLAPHLEVDVLPRIAHRDLLGFQIGLLAHQVAQLGDLVLHAGAFLTLAVSGAIAYSRRPLWVIGAWLVFYGALIEVVQGMSGLRQADPVDLLVDIVATAVGLAVVGALRILRDRWRSRSSG